MRKIRLRLDKLLEEKEMSRYALAKKINIQFSTLDRYYKNRVVRYDSDLLLRICSALDCSIDQLIQIYDED